MTFQVHALPYAQFEPLFSLDSASLARHKACYRTADAKPGYPCRVSLEDAEVGETVVLTQYVHQPADSPFHASHAIYVRHNARQARPAPGEIPGSLHKRLLSIRAFDSRAHIIAAGVVDGSEAGASIEQMFTQPEVVEIHLHNASLGCYLARVTRA